jgi:hypothetical protein
MNKHYHIMVGPMGTIMPTNLRYESYEDSVMEYLNLVRGIFVGRFEPEELTIEAVMENTMDDETRGFYMGTSTLSVLWVPCETDCSPPVWN